LSVALQTRIRLRAMEPEEWSEVADLIYVSLNYWCEANGRPAVFRGGPGSTRVFCEVYEALDPGHCLVAEHLETGRLAGSCFYRARETHCSLGIMTVHPVYFGTGIGKALLEQIVKAARSEGTPLRLVSSALNLDSFSLYSRAGFVPRHAYQDMYLSVPSAGLTPGHGLPGQESVREATLDDVEAMSALELEVAGISRTKDYRYFVENREGFWHVSVSEGAGGRLDGYLVSCGHPGLNMIGPGVARSEEQAAALLFTELNVNAGRTPLFLLPVEYGGLVQQAYSWGARNCELHFAQVLGEAPPFRGVTMPTFLPETA
jgi:GNAT superfamily N-acetyltransferase